jgi:hypothetical protein
MLDQEGAAGPADVAIVGDEAAVAAQIDALGRVGVTDFVAAEFGQGDDATRTRALLRDLAADGQRARRQPPSARTAGAESG